MLGYVLKRIVIIIPTIAMVMMIAFFISKSVRNDPAESLLTLAGMSFESPNATVEYQKNYLKLNLEKPSFYTSLIPSFYPDNLNEIISSTKRRQIKSLLEQRLSFDGIQEYLTSRDTFISHFEANESDTSIVSPTVDEKRIISTLKFATSKDEIHNYLNILKKSTILQSDDDFGKTVSSFQAMVSEEKSSFFPKFIIHGFNNQFHIWLSGLIKGEFGISIKDGRPVAIKIYSALKWTLLLLILNIIFSCLIAIPSGIYSAINPNSLYDKISSFVWMLFYSIPVFWLASMCIIYFTTPEYGTWTNIFPSPSTWIMDPSLSFIGQVSQQSKQLILPVLCLVANDIAYLSRLTRNNVIEYKEKLFATVAKAKGLSENEVIIRHVFPNAFIPIITIIAGSIPAGLSGSLIIEVIFNIPGMGRLMFESIYSADWNVVFGILVLISFCTIFFLLLADILYAVLNPKIKLS